MDIWVLGHGMIKPSPGFIWSADRKNAAAPVGEKIPFTAGLIDGTYREAEGIYQLPEMVRNVSRFPGRLVYAYTLAY